MTVQEMMYEFQRLIETMNKEFESIEKINSETIIRFLNWGYERYFNNRYLSGSTNKENVFILKKKTNELRSLINISQEILVEQDENYTTKFNFSVPDDCIIAIRADIEVKRSFFPEMTDYSYVPVQIIDYDDIDSLLPTPTNEPLIDKPAVYIDVSNDYSVIVDSYTEPRNILVTYIKKPKELSLSENTTVKTTVCELAGILHEEIVKMSVEMYITEYKYRLNQKNK